MLAAFTPDVLTPFSFDDAAAALRQAFFGVTGKEVSRQALALTLAKTALETGRWKKIHCFNWGNIKCGQTFSGMYTCILLNEVLNGKVVWFAPEAQLARGPGSALVGQRYPMPPAPEPAQGYGHPQTRMRAYANKFDGAYDYVDFISRGRYASAYPLLLAGDPAAWVHAIRKLGYFTADEATYLKGVASLFREFDDKLAGKENVPEVEVDEQLYDVAALARAVELSILNLEEALRDERDDQLKELSDDDATPTDPRELAPESENKS